MRALTIKRRELPKLALLFTRVANPPKSPEDDKTEWQKFKFACGKNWHHCQQAIEETQRMQKEARTAIPGFSDYLAAEELIVDRHIERDDKGERVFEKSGEQSIPVLKAGAQPEYEREIIALQESPEFKPVLAAVNGQNAAVDAILELEITLDLHQCPWSSVPVGVSGTYTAEIAPLMLTDIPAEFQAEIIPLRSAEDTTQGG